MGVYLVVIIDFLCIVHSGVFHINNGNIIQSSTTIYLLTKLIKVHVLANYVPFSDCKQLKKYVGFCLSLCNIQVFIVIFNYLNPEDGF